MQWSRSQYMEHLFWWTWTIHMFMLILIPSWQCPLCCGKLIWWPITLSQERPLSSVIRSVGVDRPSPVVCFTVIRAKERDEGQVKLPSGIGGYYQIVGQRLLWWCCRCPSVVEAESAIWDYFYCSSVWPIFLQKIPQLVDISRISRPRSLSNASLHYRRRRNIVIIIFDQCDVHTFTGLDFRGSKRSSTGFPFFSITHCQVMCTTPNVDLSLSMDNVTIVELSDFQHSIKFFGVKCRQSH